MGMESGRQRVLPAFLPWTMSGLTRFEPMARNGRSAAILLVAGESPERHSRVLTWRPGRMSSTYVDDRQSVERLVIAQPLDKCALGRSF